MNRIVILGCAGCGKSTLAKTLSNLLNIEVIHLDRLFWNPGWIEEEHEIFLEKQKAIVDKPSWIIDGNYRDSLEVRLEKADTVIYLDFPRLTAIKGVIKRYHQFKDKKRDTIATGCLEKIDFAFLSWVWHFKKNSKPIIMEKLSKYPNLKVIIFKNRKALNKYLKQLKIKH